MSSVVHSPHHRPYTRVCQGCRQRRPWKGGRVVRCPAACQVFVCRACADHVLAPLAKTFAAERAALAAAQQRRQAAALDRFLYPLLPPPS